MLGRRVCVAVVTFALALPAGALAKEDEEPVTPGVEDDPPSPDEDDGPPELETDDGGRRAIRGTAVPEDRTPPHEETLRKFEEQTFRDRPAGAIEDPARPRVVAKDELPAELKTPERAAPVRPAPPARPEIDWIQELDLSQVDLPVRWDPRVVRYLEFYKNDPRGRSLMSSWLQAQTRYKDLILEAIERHKLPRDLLYLCMIESAYDPLTYSRAGASGLWQFMPAGGQIYGLERSYWVDERNDPVKSTEAVMLYWRDLYDRFGNWHVVLAAFNAGYGAMLKSMAKYNTNDFWALLELEGGLPWESSVYVPKALAAAIVGHNRKAFGYDTIVGDPAIEYERVTVPKSVSFAVIGKAAGVGAEVIAALNPELLRGRTPPAVEDYVVRIPKGKKEQFALTFPQLRGDWDGYDAYVMRHGERFEDVAKTHGVSPRKLRELNGVTDVAEVRGGTIIVVPHVTEEERAKNKKEADNDLYHSEVTPGGPDEPMLVPVPDKDFRIDGKKRVFYRVVAGDTLEQIGSVLGVRIADLAAWNGLDTDAKIHARMVIVAWVPHSFDADAAQVSLLDESRLMIVNTGSAEHLDLVEGRRGRVRKKIVAKKGDTLESIGKPYGLSKYDVARINRRGYTTDLVPGEELIVYQIVDKKKAKAAGVKDTTWKNHPKKKGKGKDKAKGKAKTKGSAKKKGKA